MLTVEDVARQFLSDWCRLCGEKGWTVEGLCVTCRDMREWSSLNRAFCDLIHRGQEPAQPRGVPEAA